MNEKLIKLAERRGILISKAEAQRLELAQALAPWSRPLAIVDQGVLAINYLKRHPVIILGMMACAVALRPMRLFGWARRGWFVWRMVSGIKPRKS